MEVLKMQTQNEFLMARKIGVIPEPIIYAKKLV